MAPPRPPNRQRNPPQRRKEKDGREWTTGEQRAFLESSQAGYSTAKCVKDGLKSWFDQTFQIYFTKFPTSPVTGEEKLIHPDCTTTDVKRGFEEAVSSLTLNEVMNTYLWPLTEGPKVVQEPQSSYDRTDQARYFQVC